MKKNADQPSSIPIKRQYLVFYNAISFLTWASVVGRVLLIILLAGMSHVYSSSGSFVKGVQTLALAEVLHSLLGVVRAPVMTTIMQVASRLLLVWGVVGMFGADLLVGQENVAMSRAIRSQHDKEIWRNQVAYLGMLVAWSMTECVRYAYFVFFLGSGGNVKLVPSWLSWLRYNTFFALYPLGISCECWLVFKSITLADQWDLRYGLFLKAVLLVYIPGMIRFRFHSDCTN